MKQIQKIEKIFGTKDKILIGKTIKYYRIYYNFSQRYFAKSLEVDFQKIQKYENGKNKTSFETFLKICKIIGINKSQFIDTIDNVELFLKILNKKNE